MIYINGNNNNNKKSWHQSYHLCIFLGFHQPILFDAQPPPIINCSNLTDRCGFKHRIIHRKELRDNMSLSTYLHRGPHTVESTLLTAESSFRPPDSTHENCSPWGNLTSPKNIDEKVKILRALLGFQRDPKSKLLITLCAFRSASAKDFPTSLRWESTYANPRMTRTSGTMKKR